MHDWWIMIPSLLFSFLVSMALVAILTPALRLILLDICGTEARARFWTTYASIMLTLTPMFTVLLLSGTGFAPETVATFSPAMLRITLAGTIFGLLVGLIVIGRQVTQSIGMTIRHQDPSPTSMLHTTVKQEGREIQS